MTRSESDRGPSKVRSCSSSSSVGNMSIDSRFRDRVQRIAGMVQEIESLADPAARTVVRNLLHSLMEMHGIGLERILATIVTRDAQGERVIEELSNDPLVASLLILHGLHPQDFETRVRNAFERAASTVRLQGGVLEILGINEGIVHLRLTANGHGCGASSLRQLVEDAFYAAAPDLSSLLIEGEASSNASAIVPLEKLLASPVAGHTPQPTSNRHGETR